MNHFSLILNFTWAAWTPRRRLSVHATFFARRPRRLGKIEYGVRLGAVGVWATPNLGFCWHWILAPACKLVRVPLCARLLLPLRARLAAVLYYLPFLPVRAALPPCARPARGCSSLCAPCTRLLLVARQCCSRLLLACSRLLLAARGCCSLSARLLLAGRTAGRLLPFPGRPSLVEWYVRVYVLCV
jgi:hypothetical protein